MRTAQHRRLGGRLLTGFLLVALGANRASADPQGLFDANCALCHQKGAVGVRGQFPRLSGRIGAIAATPLGRTYLQHVLLFGMAGKIEVDGAVLIGVMPSFAQLPDEDLAALLNYLTPLGAALGSQRVAAPFTAAELAQARQSATQSPTQVNASRPVAVRVESKLGRKP